MNLITRVEEHHRDFRIFEEEVGIVLLEACSIPVVVENIQVGVVELEEPKEDTTLVDP